MQGLPVLRVLVGGLAVSHPGTCPCAHVRTCSGEESTKPWWWRSAAEIMLGPCRGDHDVAEIMLGPGVDPFMMGPLLGPGLDPIGRVVHNLGTHR